MTGGRRGERLGMILVITIAAGIAGGLLGIMLVKQFWDIDLRWLIFALLASSAVATVAAFAGLTATPRRERVVPTGPRDASAAHQRNSAVRPANTPATAEPVAPGRVVLPLPAASAAPPASDKRQWWAESVPDSGAPPASRTLPAPPLVSYESHRALIAQCPRCGDFRLDVSSAVSDCSFRCRNPRCGNTWTWTPGSPWPSVVVRRNLPERAR